LQLSIGGEFSFFNEQLELFILSFVWIIIEFEVLHSKYVYLVRHKDGI
jgi:hypothetical protein